RGEYLEDQLTVVDGDGMNPWISGQAGGSDAGRFVTCPPRESLAPASGYSTRCRVNTTACPIGTPLRVSCTVSVSGAPPTPDVTSKITGDVGRLSSCEPLPGKRPRKPGAIRGVVGPIPNPLGVEFFG